MFISQLGLGSGWYIFFCVGGKMFVKEHMAAADTLTDETVADSKAYLVLTTYINMEF